jgi:hypothetical protein
MHLNIVGPMSDPCILRYRRRQLVDDIFYGISNNFCKKADYSLR